MLHSRIYPLQKYNCPSVWHVNNASEAENTGHSLAWEILGEYAYVEFDNHNLRLRGVI